MDREAVCIGGVLDGQRKLAVGRTLQAFKPLPLSVIEYQSPDEPAKAVPSCPRDLYRLELLNFHHNGALETIPCWIVEGTTNNEAIAHVFHVYSERGK